MLLRNRRSRSLLIGGVLLAGLLLCVLVLSERSGAAPEGSAAASTPENPVTEQFSILDSVAGEAVPAESKTTVGSLTEVILPGNQGPRDVSAMGTARAIGGKDVTVALIGESLCAIQAMNAACGPISDVADGRLIGARPRSCGHYWIFGLAPDGVKEVQVDQSGDGGTESVIPVVGNVFEGVVKAAPTSVIGIDGRGDVQFETDLPLDYFDATNEACE